MSKLVFNAVDKLVRLYEDARERKLKRTFAACGSDVYIGKYVVVWSPELVRVGNHVGIHSLTHIFASGGVTIGSHVQISAGCSIASITHSIEVETRFHGIEQPVVIQDHVWLGTGAIVLPGVTIGRGAVIGAGSIVTRDIPPMTVAVGTPARVIRTVPDTADAAMVPEH